MSQFKASTASVRSLNAMIGEADAFTNEGGQLRYAGVKNEELEDLLNRQFGGRENVSILVEGRLYIRDANTGELSPAAS